METTLSADTQKTSRLFTKIIISCLVLLIVGYINSLWKNIEYHSWFDALNKPIISPSPRWIVGVIWTFMFITLGIAIGHIWHTKATASDEKIQRKAKIAIQIFILQILVNMTVPSFFFWMHNLYLVLLGAILNLTLVIILIVRFFDLKKMAGYILIPFLLWLVYAVALDVSFVLIN